MVPITQATVLNGTEVVTNLTYSITPTENTLNRSALQTFSFNVSRTPAPDTISMRIYNSTTTLYSSSISGNGIISTILNISNQNVIYGEFNITVGSETFTINKIWTVTNIYSGDYSLFAFLSYPIENEFGTRSVRSGLWWGIIKFLLIIGILLGVSAGAYYLDPFDSTFVSFVMALIVIWFFSSFGWLSVDIPGMPDAIDKIVIASLYSLTMIGLLIWRYRSQ